VQFTALKYNPHIVLLIALCLLTSLDHLGSKYIGQNEMSEVIDSIMVSQAIVGQTKWSYSDTRAKVKDVQSGEFGSEFLGGRNKFVEGTKVYGVGVNKLMSVGGKFGDFGFSFLLVFDSSRDDVH
jgi:hypothetical protein